MALSLTMIPCAWLELAVIAFQVLGVVGLCTARLLPHPPWATIGRIAFIASLVGLGIFGALCGREDSEFALFAGATMTGLLIGMTVGNGHADATIQVDHGAGIPTLASA